jgi:hypothetical protein
VEGKLGSTCAETGAKRAETGRRTMQILLRCDEKRVMFPFMVASVAEFLQPNLKVYGYEHFK